MRTYGLVCMAAAALTVIAGYPTFWFGGQVNSYLAGDPTRVIQGIVTGIGFLGAGVIMRDGLNISGLTTAASIWTCSAIGIMVGVGFMAFSHLPFRHEHDVDIQTGKLAAFAPGHRRHP
jgi:putative Mg2+ transporter-C (MgtC) family protein